MPDNIKAGVTTQFVVDFFDGSTPPRQVTDPAQIAAQVGVGVWNAGGSAQVAAAADGLSCNVMDPAAETFPLTFTSPINPAITATDQITSVLPAPGPIASAVIRPA